MRQFKIEERFTQRSNNFQRYTADVNQHSIMSPDEEAEVAWRARQGDQAAMEKLVNSNLRFVISVAKQYAAGRADRMDDLINEGNLGLIEAAQDFDPSTGFKFISYAVWHVRKNILKYLSDNTRTVRLPQNRVQSLNKMKRIESDLANELERDPHDWEILDRFFEEEVRSGRLGGMPGDSTVAGMKDAMRAGQRAANLEGPSLDDSESDWGPIHTINADPEGTDHIARREDARVFLDDQINELSPIEQDIVRSIHGIGRPAETIRTLAETWGYSPESIRQKHKKALKKMKLKIRMSRLTLEDVL
jgi:RNA polymerase primary sigma factor